MTKKNNTVVPEWFKGLVYKDGDVVTNYLSGQSIELNNVELSIYEFIMGFTLAVEQFNYSPKKEELKNFHEGLDWFRRYNAEAYMVLLD